MTLDEDRIRRLERAIRAKEEENELARERIARRPKVIDLAALRSANQKHRHAEPATTPTAAATPRRISYWREGKRWNERSGEWVEVNPKSFESPVFLDNLGKVLQVVDPAGPTVTKHPHMGAIVQRGCLVCGYREVVRPAQPIKFGRHKGAMCVRCHIEWTKPIMRPKGFEAIGRFVTLRLRDEGWLADDVELDRAVEVEPGQYVTEELYLSTWKAYAWAYRLHDKDRVVDPAAQEPPSRPFGYLAGPIRTAEPEVAEAST